MMKTSYDPGDVILLLKDITGLVQPEDTKQRERAIQSGRHYSEMLPVEYSPSEKYMEAYRAALADFSAATAQAVALLSEKIMSARGPSVVLVSLARAGTPVGILLKRYLRKKYDIEVPHYSISIIRGRGIDKNAMRFLLERYPAKDLLFVDGWIGKGAILRELQAEIASYEGVSGELAVLADPANITPLCGTHEDILIPSSCLNSTISGLISRTFLREDIIGKEDFHGALYYGELRKFDLSYDFIRAIEREFPLEVPENKKAPSSKGIEEVLRIAADFGIEDINLIKPGIGEATRVLLRRIPDCILIAEKAAEEPSLFHILQLAKEKDVPVRTYPLRNYKACGIIRKLTDL